MGEFFLNVIHEWKSESCIKFGGMFHSKNFLDVIFWGETKPKINVLHNVLSIVFAVQKHQKYVR